MLIFLLFLHRSLRGAVLHFITYKLVCLFSMRNVYTQSFEHLKKVCVRAIKNSKLVEQEICNKIPAFRG